MPSFSYSAIGADGKRVRGVVSAVDEVSALERLARNGLTPIDLTQGSTGALRWWQREVGLRKSEPNAAKMLPAFSALATMLSAKLPILDALRFVADQEKDPTLKIGFSGLADDIESGLSLSAALDARSLLPARVATIIKLGETTDTLPSAASRVVDLLKSEAQLAGEVRSALVYPVILLGMSVFVLGLLVFFLVPTLTPVFEAAGAAPPPVLAAMEGVRVAVTSAGWQSVAVGGALLLGLFMARGFFWRAFRALALRLPVTGPYLRKRASLAYCQTLAVMTGAGLPLMDGMAMAEETIAVGPWRAQLAQSRADVEAGQSVSQALVQCRFLDPVALTLIRAGDETDQVKEMLSAAADALQGSTQTTLKRALSLLTPILTLLIGGLVGALIVSTITAILDLNDIAF